MMAREWSISAAVAAMLMAGGCTFAPQTNYVYTTPSDAPVHNHPPRTEGILGSCSAGPAEPCAACGAVVEDCTADPFTPALTTHQIESGKARLETAEADALEYFLRDLNQRKDYALACNAGRSTETSEYLWHWVQRVCGELQRRGYTMDGSGNLYAGQRMVTLR